MPSLDPDLLILALARWDAPYSSTAFSLAKELSKQRRVFLIDNPFTFKDLLLKWNHPSIQRRLTALLFRKNTLQKALPDFPDLYCCVPPLMLPINWLPEGNLYRFFAKINQARMLGFLKKIIRKERVSKFHFLNIFNPFYSFPSLEGMMLRAYYSVDNIAESLYVQKHGPRLEKQVAKQADFCLATSRKLQEDLQSIKKSNVFLLPNAADTQLFERVRKETFPKPKVYAAVDKQVVLYIGAIGFRLDFELLDQVIGEVEEAHFVFVGPKGKGYDSRLEKRENVSFTGAIPQAELLPYLQHATCALIPFRLNPLTAAIYPLKIHEYLVAGLPVISTPFSPDIQGFSEQIHLAVQAADFGKLIKKTIKYSPGSLKENTDLYIESHSWKDRAKKLLEILKQFTSG